MSSVIKIILAVGVGSFLGGIARYGLTKVMTSVMGFTSTWGTFTSNVIGCFLIGLFYGLFERYGNIDQHWRLFLTVGFCGGFTTFSTFVNENFNHLSNGRYFEMAAYSVGSFAVGLLMLYLGQLAVNQLFQH